MFLGAGDAGKTSLLDGLMNRELGEAESTVLADTKTVSYQWVQAADMVDEAWSEYTTDDETKSLGVKCRLVNESDRDIREAVNTFMPSVKSFKILGALLTPTNVRAILKATRNSIIEEAKCQRIPPTSKPDVVMHVWDCGGQQLFINILAAFLTPRTMFITVFDASIDLGSVYQEKWHHDGKAIEGTEQYITNLELMSQWLQLIHSSLVAKKDDLPTSSHQCSDDDSLPKYPRAIMVGSRRDKISSETAEAVKRKLDSACSSAAFGDIVVDKLLVDNTKAGKGKEGEDPGYKAIRRNIHKFAMSLVVPTPLSWVVFRQVLQKISKPVLTTSEVMGTAVECNIPEDTVPSVLHFYHQLGAMLHYSMIPSLANIVIVEPQWLIQQFRQLLMPEQYGHRQQHLQRYWELLDNQGVLAKKLYLEMWKESCQELPGGPQVLADLLDHFDLAKEIGRCFMDFDFPGIKYFMPCMLKVRPEEDARWKQSGAVHVRQAATLHVIFNTGYVPPGYFVRFIARISTNEAYTPCLEGVVYRDGIIFRCNEIDEFSITESLKSIKVKYYRKSLRRRRHVCFSSACISFLEKIYQVSDEVLHWLPSIKAKVAFTCSCSDGETRFVPVKSDTHKESVLYCQHCSEQFNLEREHKYWLKVNWQGEKPVDNGRLTDDEIEEISRKVNGHLYDLVTEMEMEYSFSEAVSSLDPSPDATLSVLSDFSAGVDGTRHKMAEFLREAKFYHTSKMHLRGKYRKRGKVQQQLEPSRDDTSPEDPQEQVNASSTPTIPQLQCLRSSTTLGTRIMHEIGASYLDFGTRLLEDRNGSRMHSLEHQFQRDCSAINWSIFYLWVNGKGRKPTTWETLVKVLQEVELNELAHKLQQHFHH